MKQMKSLSVKRNSIWNILNYSFSALSLFFLFPFLIRHLGDSNYGFFIFLSTINGVASIANFGFGEATLRFTALYYTQNKMEEIRKVISTSLLIYTVLGIAIGMILFFLAPIIPGLLKDKEITENSAIILIRVSALTFVIRFVFGIFSNIPQAIQRYDIFSIIAICETVLRVTLYIISTLYGYGLTGLVISEFIVSVIYVSINYFVSSRILSTTIISTSFSLSMLKNLFSYSIYAALSQIVGLLWQYTDRILLGYFIGSAAIAYFAVPQQIIFKILGIVIAGAAVLFPRFSVERIDENVKTIYKTYTYILLNFTILIFGALAFVIPEFLELWISADFASNAKDIAFILAVSCMIRGAFSVYENLFKGIGKPVYNLYIIIGSSMIIVILDFLLIPNMGLKGAGFAYLFSPIAGVAAIYMIYRKLFKESMLEPMLLYITPLIIGYIYLMFAMYLKVSLEYTTSWFNLIFLASMFFAGMFILLFAYQLFINRRFKLGTLNFLNKKISFLGN